MLTLSCEHPDLIDFINAKKKAGAVTKANISVRVTDKFMKAVENNEDWVMTFTRPETNETITKTANARDIFDLMCENNWDSAEPGILFWDRIEKWNMLSENKDFQYAGLNPCAEEPLPAGGSCLLGAINLSQFVKNSFCDNAHFDDHDFVNTVRIAVNALNDVLDEGLPLHPLEEQRRSVADWRQIGLGIMGLADCLIRLGFVYGSKEANEFCENLAHLMFSTAVTESDHRGAIYGAYPKFNKDATNNSPMLMKSGIKVEHLNNSQILTIAPTGTISTMLGVSGGIEPIFANSYTRKTESLHNDTEPVYYKVYTPIVKEYMDWHRVSKEDDLPSQFVTSSSIRPDDRIDCQAAWQRWIDASISSTINLPHDATVGDVRNIYTYAWKSGLKGITVYREGCARAGVLVSDKEEGRGKSGAHEQSILKRGDIIECSDDLVGKKRKIISGCGSLHVLAFFDPITGDMQEVYLNKGSTGGCANFMTGLSRTISLLCRAGVDVHTIKDQLDSTGACPSYTTRRATKHDTSEGSCCPMAIGNVLVEMYDEMQSELNFDGEESFQDDTTQGERHIVDSDIPTCPECGAPLVFEGGCNSCKNCGYSKCS